MRQQLISRFLALGAMQKSVQKFNQNFRFRQLYVRLLKAYRIRIRFSQYIIPALLPSFLIVKAISDTDKMALEKLVVEADHMYAAGQYEKLYSFLKAHERTNYPEVLWRLARAIFEKCRSIKDNKVKLQNLEKALELVDKALEIREICWEAHKWRAILLDYVWREKSTKGRILHSFEVKKHMERAVELNGDDATSHYLLGEWCFTFADMPWYQRKVASALFASPPTSTYREAYVHFKTAEFLSPNFYAMNLLMLGKCCLKLNLEDDAIKYFEQAYNYPVKTADDLKAYEEAEEYLKKMKVLE